MKRLSLPLGIVVAIAACNGETLVVGGSDAGVSAADAGASPQVYVGYVENKHFASGSDRVTLTLTSDTTGTIFLGDPPALLAPTNPDVGWPPGLGDGGTCLDGMTLEEEHFAFTLRNVTRDGARLTFDFVADEFWKSWCELQRTTYTSANSPYSCVPNEMTTTTSTTCSLVDDAGTSQPIDCGKLCLCHEIQVCQCNATGCTVDASMPRSNPIYADLRFDGDSASGSTDLGVVILTRQP